MENAITKAIKLAGSQSALAKVVGISPQALGVQIRKGNIRPAHCITIEEAFLGQIDRYELNPQHFGSRRTNPSCLVIVVQNFSSESSTV